MIELLVSIAIVSVISICFFNIINNSTVMNKKNEIDISAMNIAQTVMEDLRNDIKEGRTIGLDMNEDGEDDFIVNNSEWNGSLEQIYNNTSLLVTSKKKGHIVYDVKIQELKREKNEISSNKFLYTIKIVVKQRGKNYNGVQLETQLYTP